LNQRLVLLHVLTISMCGEPHRCCNG